MVEDESSLRVIATAAVTTEVQVGGRLVVQRVSEFGEPVGAVRCFFVFVEPGRRELESGGRHVAASPPNLLRHQAIGRFFGEDSTAVTSISDPYQHAASCLRRYGEPGSKVGGIVRSWVTKATAIAGIRDACPHFPFLPYEAYVARPEAVNDALGLPVRPFEGPGKKGSGANGIEDLSPRTTAFLEPEEIARVTELLTPHTALLEQFGYALHDGESLHAQLSERAPEEYARGRDRRTEWNKGPPPKGAAA